MTITFTKVSLPYGWLGNMAPYQVVAENQTWRTTEHLFQALRFDDREIRERIWRERSPMAAKMVARGLIDRATIAPRSEADLRNMRRCLRLKICQHLDLHRDLLRTGDETIVEDVTRRQRGSALFWGAALVDGEWRGENWLGRMWVDLREELRRA